PLPRMESRLVLPLEAHEASYLAASARMASLRWMSTVQMYSFLCRCQATGGSAKGLPKTQFAVLAHLGFFAGDGGLGHFEQ
ncbi:hypothetical protein ACXWOY_09335, partial [Streptococcus pyogenes]